MKSLGEIGPQAWPRLATAIVGVGIALGGVAFVMLRISQLLTDDWITLTRLSLDEFQAQVANNHYLQGLYEELDVHREELYGHVADDIPTLYRRLCEVNRRDRAESGVENALSQDIAETRTAAHSVVEFANYYRTRQRFRKLGRQLICGALATVAGAFIFAYSTSSETPEKPLHVVIETAH